MLQYPLTLDEYNSPFLKITAYEWTTRGKRDQQGQSTKTIIETIFLPISRNGITEQITNNWDVTAQMSHDISVKGGLSAAISIGGKKLTELAPELAKYGAFKTGQMLNDYSALTFSGNNFREFALTYEMYPQSSTEAEEIKSIAEAFKRNSLPLYEGPRVYYPRFWRIEMIIPNGLSPVNFNDCVLTDVSSDYFQDDNITTYIDGNVNLNLTLNFREITRLSRNNI